MKRQTQQNAANQQLLIHWLKPCAFNIPIARDQQQRLGALDRPYIPGSLPERTIDCIAVLASQVGAAPIALLVLLDRNRQWFKSQVGLRGKDSRVAPTGMVLISNPRQARKQ